jgi:hypothetical protein
MAALESLKPHLIPAGISTATVGAIVVVLYMFGIVGPSRDQERLDTHTRLVRVEARQEATDALVKGLSADIKEQLTLIRVDLREMRTEMRDSRRQGS